MAPPLGTNLEDLARRVRYVGSPEHKDGPSFAGLPHFRKDASICDSAITQGQAQDWLSMGIRLGNIGAPWENAFPRYVWYKTGAIMYEGRLVNQTKGEYKGYPLSKDQWPENIRENDAQAGN